MISTICANMLGEKFKLEKFVLQYVRKNEDLILSIVWKMSLFSDRTAHILNLLFFFQKEYTIDRYCFVFHETCYAIKCFLFVQKS